MTATDLLASDAIPDPVAFLMHAEPEIEGRMPWSSNGTFLVTMRCGDPDDPAGAEQRAIAQQVDEPRRSARVVVHALQRRRCERHRP